jgi:hypothetical protein
MTRATPHRVKPKHGRLFKRPYDIHAALQQQLCRILNASAHINT